MCKHFVIRPPTVCRGNYPFARPVALFPTREGRDPRPANGPDPCPTLCWPLGEILDSTYFIISEVHTFPFRLHILVGLHA